MYSFVTKSIFLCGYFFHLARRGNRDWLVVISNCFESSEELLY